MRFLRATLWVVAGLAVPIVAALILFAGLGAAGTLQTRISFQIVTGPSGGTYFPIGQLIAGLISHPPGVDRCESASFCGPSGLIISARTSNGAVANVLAVNRGSADSGFVQGDVLAQALGAQGAFQKSGKQTQVRVIAALFREDVYLVVARNSKIRKVDDLRGKRVSLGVDGSGRSVTAHAILAAYRLAEWRMKVRRQSSDVDARLLQQGKLDAFFFVGGRPAKLIDKLIADGTARLVPIDGAGRKALLQAPSGYSAITIAANTYRGTPAIETVDVQALWIVNAHQPDALVYGIAKALFDSGNRAALDEDRPGITRIRLETATGDLTALLHPGARRFFRESGLVRTPNRRVGKI